jgi:hypothetical protein
MADTADILITNGKVITMDGAMPRAEALALKGNRIIFVGSTQAAMAYAGQATRVVDAGGATVMPGFNESHMHIFGGSLSLTQLPLSDVHGQDQLKTLVEAYAAEHRDLPLLVGYGADYVLIGSDGVARHKLDAIISDRPLLIMAADYHTAWANTAALNVAGLIRGKKLSIGNEIVIGADGFATGELRESEAIGPVLDLGASGGRERFGVATGGDPDSVNAEQRASDLMLFRRGLAYCASRGITSFQNMDGSHYQLELLDAIERSEGLPVRVRMPFHMKNFMPLSELADKADAWRRRYDTDRLRCNFVKMFADGVVESGTAYMVGGYGDNPDENGDPLFADEQFHAIAAEADRLGLQIAVHAIGSAAVRQVLDAYENATAVNGRRDSRHRIEHIETIEPEDVPRLDALGVVGSMQPTHPPGARAMPLEPYLSRIGEKRWPLAFAWRTIADTGVKLVFGTDWPVTGLNPFACIQDAMTRKPWKEGLKDQRLTLAETLEAYTRNGAWVEFMEDRKGVLKPGYLADIVVLDNDIELVSSEAIGEIKPVLTICDGKISYQA